MSEYYQQFFPDECQQYSVIIEDDGKVCYGYLLLNERIIAHVWIYNQAETPLETTWNRDEMPFLNPSEYVKNHNAIAPVSKDEEFDFHWLFTGDNCSLEHVKIFIRNRLAVMMTEKSKPGWSVNVKKDGPVARMLIDEKNN